MFCFPKATEIRQNLKIANFFQEMAEDRRERQALLDQDSDEDDDFFLHGPKTHGIRQQIDEVTNIAKDNIIRIAERGERLDSLEERSARLDDAAGNFRAGAYQLKRNAWWQQAKFKAFGASFLVILLFLLIVIIIASKEEN